MPRSHINYCQDRQCDELKLELDEQASKGAEYHDIGTKLDVDKRELDFTVKIWENYRINISDT